MPKPMLSTMILLGGVLAATTLAAPARERPRTLRADAPPIASIDPERTAVLVVGEPAPGLRLHDVRAAADAQAALVDWAREAGIDVIDVRRDGGGLVGVALGDLEVAIVAGSMTHDAVDRTVRDAGARGLRVIVATDATATRDLPAPDDGAPLRAADVQRAALAILADRYAELRRVDEIAALPLR
jgi:hypothetical protein